MLDHNRTWQPWILACLLAAVACNQPVEVVGAKSTVQEDLLHVKRLVKDGIPLTLNLADEAQRRFLHGQLTAAGLIAEDRGLDLADALNEMAVAHAEQEPSQKLTLLQMEGEYGTWHPDAMITYLHKESDNRYRAGALYSIAGTIHATLMLQLFDAAWQPIGELAVADDWLENHLTLSAEGQSDTPGVSAVFTYFYHAREDATRGTAQVIFKHLGDVPDPTFAGINPSRAANSTSTCEDGDSDCIRVCDQASRSGQNCDYMTQVSSTSRQLQVSGTVSFASNVSELVETDNIVATQTLSLSTGDACQTSITTDQVSTTCPPTDSAFAFGISGTEVCWDDGSSIFNTSDSCWATSNTKQTNYYNLQFTAVLADADGTQVPVAVTSVDDAPPIDECNEDDSATCQIPPIYFVWGCLPAATPVRMADGSLKPIEEVQVEEQVLADASGRTLTVVDTIWGTEEEPLVVIEDDRGNRLKATNTHPIVTARGVMLAKQVAVGDVLTTENGPSKVVAIGQETTDAKVWNLNLGGDGETVTNDNTTLFANGILVGDNRMQGRYERRYETSGGAIDEIPKQWQRDYKQWLERQKSEAGGP
jgi:hypothetical protein